MKKTKKLLGILLSCLMLMSMLSVGVFAAEGTKDNPINANDKWFGYGVDIFLLNPTLAAGDTDGIWYELTADKAGILHVENSYKDVDYQITVNVNGKEYLAYENGIYNKPIMTLPVAVGDVISIHIIAQDTTKGGLVYCSAKFITGENDINEMVKLKGADTKVWIANGATVYLQDDSLQAEYASMGLKLESSVNGKGITVISGTKEYTDTDGDGYVELKLGGSAGSAGSPPVKPLFTIKNESGQDAWFVLNVVENTAHECVYDNDDDIDCNTCSETRVFEYTVQSFSGAAMSEVTSDGLSGLAFQFKLSNIAGLAVVEGTKYMADYSNACVTPDSTGTYKLVKMGAVVSSNKGITYLDSVDNDRTMDAPANKVVLDGEGAPFFAIRIINIPEERYNAIITVRPYYIYENAQGEEVVVYGDEQSACVADHMH